MNEDMVHVKTEKRFTNLLLYRQYSTYQILLEAYPQNGLTVERCYSKVILYIMNWFKKRLGKERQEAFLMEVVLLNKGIPDI